MPEYLAPGVYVEEIEGPGSIQGVSTSTAGFLGETERGPLKPRLITSITQFLNIYGSFLPDKYLSYCVDGFFKNGGRRCFIARIVNASATSSSKSEIIIPNLADPLDPIKTLTITALAPGESGDRIYYKIQQASNGNPKNFNIIILYFKNEPDNTTVSNGVFTPDPTHQFNRFLKKKREPSLLENYADLSFDLNSPNYYKKIINGISNLITIDDNDPSKIPDNIQSSKITIFDLEKIKSSNPDHQRFLRNFLKFNFGLEWLEDTDNPIVNDAERTIIFDKKPNKLVIKYNTEITLADVQLNGILMYKFSIENGKDFLSSNIIALTGGTDGGSPTLSDYQGRDLPEDEKGVKESTGLKGFEKIDEISIISSPDETSVQGLRSELIDHCENQKFRFAILQEDKSKNEIESLKIDRETKYAAVYIPWLQIFHPETGNKILIPPGGHIAGIYARTDIERGVIKSPAGVQAKVRGVISLQKQIIGPEIEILNPRGINSIINKPGYGIVVWGARTMTTEVNWRYVAIRRFFNFAEKSIGNEAERLVFEPNTPRLWSRVIATITPFLSGLRRDGALRGKTDDEAFSVKCDETTMTPEDIKQGKLIIQIALLVAGISEFVILRFSQKSGFNTEIEEI